MKNTTVEDRANSHHWFFPHLSVWYLEGDRGELNVSFCDCSFLLAYETYFTSFISSFSCLQVYGPSVGHKQANELSWVARTAWFSGSLMQSPLLDGGRMLCARIRHVQHCWGFCNTAGIGEEQIWVTCGWKKRRRDRLCWEVVLSCRGQLSESLNQPYCRHSCKWLLILKVLHGNNWNILFSFRASRFSRSISRIKSIKSKVFLPSLLM